MPRAADPVARAEVIAGLRQLADFLDANPDIPVGRYSNRLTYLPDGPDESERAEVDRIAAALGVIPTGRDHYRAARSFGRVTYEAVAIRASVMAAHDALTSYAGHVTP